MKRPATQTLPAGRKKLTLNPPRKEWTPGTYTPQYSDRPDGNYSAVLPNFLKCGTIILPMTDGRGALCLGPEEAAQKSNLHLLQSHNIHLIINATPTFANHHEPHIDYIRVDVNDEPSANLLPWMDAIADRIENELSTGKSVYVHCQMGISRSSSLVIAYLMKYQGMTRDQAYIHTKELRPKIEPNIGFWKQLTEYESLQQQQGETKKKSCTTIDTTLQTSLLAYLQHPTSQKHLQASVIAVACVSSSALSTCFESSGSVEEILLHSLNYVYDNPTDSRIEWLSCIVRSIKVDKTTMALMLDAKSEFFTEYWPGEFSSTKVARILSALDATKDQTEGTKQEGCTSRE
tara:strand:+ start:90 stop:1130 length:1041 start_codon:yes stop_codon:yes gene_type:complete